MVITYFYFYLIISRIQYTAFAEVCYSISISKNGKQKRFYMRTSIFASVQPQGLNLHCTQKNVRQMLSQKPLAQSSLFGVLLNHGSTNSIHSVFEVANCFWHRLMYFILHIVPQENQNRSPQRIRATTRCLVLLKSKLVSLWSTEKWNFCFRMRCRVLVDRPGCRAERASCLSRSIVMYTLHTAAI